MESELENQWNQSDSGVQNRWLLSAVNLFPVNTTFIHPASDGLVTDAPHPLILLLNLQ